MVGLGENAVMAKPWDSELRRLELRLAAVEQQLAVPETPRNGPPEPFWGRWSKPVVLVPFWGRCITHVSLFGVLFWQWLSK